MIILDVQATHPMRKRPTQMSQTLLNMVMMEATMATVLTIRDVRLRPMEIKEPPKRLPMISPTTAQLLITVFQNALSSSLHPKNTW